MVPHPHVVNGGNAKTIQLPAISLNGFGNLIPMEYGPKHMAIPIPRVSVGTRYNLKNDEYGPPGTPRKNPSLTHLNGYPKIHGIGRYPNGEGRFPGILSRGIPFPIVELSVLNTGYNGLGNLGTHPKT